VTRTLFEAEIDVVGDRERTEALAETLGFERERIHFAAW
jgi:hypothetical protein